MANYHAHIKSFSRGKGESSVAAAAYRAGIDLVDSRTQKLHRYSKRKGVLSYHMLVPAGAPKWCNDAAVFWDMNENKESRANARLARELETTLPHELTKEQREKLGLELGQMLVDRYQAAVLVALHAPSSQGDQRNFHVHLLMSARKITPEGFGERAGAAFDATKGAGAEEIKVVRELVSKTINAHLAAAALSERVDHRRLTEQARDARAKGDHDLAKQLDRMPKAYVSKEAYARARRVGSEALPTTPTGPVASSSAAQMDQAMAQAQKEGRLMAVSPLHSRVAAEIDLVRGQRDALLPKRDYADRKVSIVAVHLSRLGQIAKSSGKASEVLNSEARLIEDWLASQNEAARAALDSIESIPSLRVAPELSDAIATLRTPRVEIYGTKLWLYHDTEVLRQSITDYAKAVCLPHEKQRALKQLRSQMSTLPADPQWERNARLASLRRQHYLAKKGVSQAAWKADNQRTIQCMTAMVEAAQKMRAEYPITHSLPVADPGSWSVQESVERSSDSNRQQLKFNPPGGLGMR